MKYWFDTEFIEDGQTIDLLSIGMVSEDGRELYLENKDADLSKASPWVRENVFPSMLWTYGVQLSRAAIRQKVVDFVHPLDPPQPYGTKPEFWAYYCVAPETRVLTSDLNWVPAGSVSVGDVLMGFDEDNPPGSGRSRRWRQWRKSTVTEVRSVERPCYDLVFSDGTNLRCSADHQWLVSSGYEAAQWVTTENLVANGPKTKSHVVKPLNTWCQDMTRGGGYLAAAFDGEGHLTQRDLSETGMGVSTHQTRIGFAQRDNAMLAEVLELLDRRGFGYTVEPPREGVVRLSVGKREDLFRLLGSIRPHRLLDKFDAGAMGSMSLNTVQLVEKTFVGPCEVSAVTTSTGTFIAEGLASHNCSYDWVVLCQLFGRMIDLPSYWPKYCMDFKQWLVEHGDFEISKLPENEAHNALADAKWLRDAYLYHVEEKY